MKARSGQNYFFCKIKVILEPIAPEVPPIRISISTKNSTPEPVIPDSEPEKAQESKPDESAEVKSDEVEIVGAGKTDEIDKLFENNERKVNALDLFDDNEADLSKTKIKEVAYEKELRKKHDDIIKREMDSQVLKQQIQSP